MLNKVQFIGHLGRDPETRHMPNGTAVCNFSVASSERWKDKQGEQQERTEWLRCSAFDRLAEICGEYLRKGSLVYVEGSLQTRKYEDKDGTERYVTECRLREMKMLGGKPEREEAQKPAARPAPRAAAYGGGFDDTSYDDIPF